MADLLNNTTIGGFRLLHEGIHEPTLLGNLTVEGTTTLKNGLTITGNIILNGNINGIIDWSNLINVPSPVITLSGDVTGSLTLTNLGNATITLTVGNNSHSHDNSTITSLDWSKLLNVPDPTITLTGDVTGSLTMTNLGNITITATVANDSHTHDTRYYTESEADSRFVNVTGDTITGNLTVNGTITGSLSGNASTLTNADMLDNLHETSFVRTASLQSNLDTFYRAGMFGFSTSTISRPTSYGQGIAIVSSGAYHNDSNNWITQLAFGTDNNTAWFRGKTNSDGWGAWKTIWHSGNFNPNSKLNTSGGTMTGNLTINGDTTVNNIYVNNALYKKRSEGTGTWNGFVADYMWLDLWQFTRRNPNGSYLDELMHFDLNTKDAIFSSNITATKVYGAVLNDYLEYRSSPNVIQYGYVVLDGENGKVYKCNKDRAKNVLGISTDTLGFAIGKQGEGDTPILVSGRVLVYLENKNKLEIGDLVCSLKSGKVRKMKWWERILFPTLIIGTVSEFPTYEEWGTDKVKVDNRIWIKVR